MAVLVCFRDKKYELCVVATSFEKSHTHSSDACDFFICISWILYWMLPKTWYISIKMLSCLRQSIPVSSTQPSVLSSVRPLPTLWTRYFENEWTDFAANWHKWSTR